MKMRLISVALLSLLWASVSEAGVLKFFHRHAVKPVAVTSGKVVVGTAKGSAKATKAVAKKAYHVAV